jgi:hypothetical protein
MTRGHRPFVAIREISGILAARGAMIVSVSPECGLPFDLVTWEGGVITLIRVRRLKYAGYHVDDIEVSCAREIAMLRKVPVMERICRELHVRGPDRHWHRYLVLQDGLEELEAEDSRVYC